MAKILLTKEDEVGETLEAQGMRVASTHCTNGTGNTLVVSSLLPTVSESTFRTSVNRP